MGRGLCRWRRSPDSIATATIVCSCSTGSPANRWRQLRPSHTFIVRELGDRYDLAREMMVAEIATSVAGIGLGVHPFNQPDVELAKVRAQEAMGSAPVRVDLVDIFSPILAEHLENLLVTLVEGDYFALHAYLPVDPGDRFGPGPAAFQGGKPDRERHHLGLRAPLPPFDRPTPQGRPQQRGVPPIGRQPHETMSPSPRPTETFGRVIAAQALGDYLALKENGRRVLRIDLGPNRDRGLQAVIDAIG